jgi:hypothetical protein
MVARATMRASGSRLDRRRHARVNETCWMVIRSAFHRSRAFAPRRPFGRPARAWAGPAVWPPRCRSSTSFRPRRSAGDRRGPGPRPRAPLPAGVTLLWTSTSLADFCNLIRRAGTPDERSILAREWGFRPAARRHQPMPVASAWTMRRRIAGLRAATCTRRLARVVLHLRGRGRSRAKASERRRAARRRTTLRVPSSWRFGHPGHRDDSSRGLEILVTPRTGRDPPRMPPREGRHRREDRGAFFRDGILTRGMDCSFTRARIAAPSRRLGRGIARERACLFCRLRGACALTRQAPEATRPAEPLEPKPRGAADRSTHHGFYDRISSRADVPRTS